MKGGARLDRVDALRALALLPVLVVNLSSFGTPDNGPMLVPRPEGSGAAWLATWLASALLMGKGITLLNFLAGYSLTLGRDPQRRARRVLGLGLLHGFLLYFGDILTSYALAMLMALRHRRSSLRRLLRRGIAWLAGGCLLLGMLSLWTLGGSDASMRTFSAVSSAPDGLGWWLANAELYAYSLLLLLIFLPSTYGLMLLGLAAGRLRLLSHRCWRARWQILSRAALPLLGLNLVAALGTLAGKTGDGFFLSLVMALVTVPAWVGWLLARAEAPPRWLALAGRNTLSIYLGGSLLIVLLLSGAGLHWQAGSLACLLVGASAWALLAGLSAAAAAQGRRLPLEAWMARP